MSYAISRRDYEIFRTERHFSLATICGLCTKYVIAMLKNRNIEKVKFFHNAKLVRYIPISFYKWKSIKNEIKLTHFHCESLY